jgi:hypothetical protein
VRGSGRPGAGVARSRRGAFPEGPARARRRLH